MKRFTAFILVCVLLFSFAASASAADPENRTRYGWNFSLKGTGDSGQYTTARKKPYAGNWAFEITYASQKSVGQGTWFNVYHGTTAMGNGVFVKDTAPHNRSWKKTPNKEDAYRLFVRMEQGVGAKATDMTGTWAPYFYA